MIMEHAPFGRRGYYASYTLQGVQAGQVMAAAVFLPLAYFMPSEAFNEWGWRIPFLMSALVLVAGYFIRKEVHETPAFVQEEQQDKVAKSPISEAFRHSWKCMVLVAFMALMNVIPVVATIFGAAYAVQPAYGIGFDKSVYLWIPVVGNIVAVLVIPFVGNLSDKIGRRPTMIAGCLGSGLLAFVYLYAISIQNVPLAFGVSILMWGMVYQGTTRYSQASTRSCSRPAIASRPWPLRKTSAPCSPPCCPRCSPPSPRPARTTFRWWSVAWRSSSPACAPSPPTSRRKPTVWPWKTWATHRPGPWTKAPMKPAAKAVSRR